VKVYLIRPFAALIEHLWKKVLKQVTSQLLQHPVAVSE
jgi:hypothetical protein